ncbi:hypothetical protein [Kribbella sp. NPDC055071]|jgi:hypothetical protein
MAYNGINLDYDKITSVVNLLHNAHEFIIPKVQELHTRVDELVNDGLVFKQASDVIRDTYKQFDTSLTQAVQGIESFKSMFDSIKTNAEDFDSGIVKALNEKK